MKIKKRSLLSVFLVISIVFSLFSGITGSAYEKEEPGQQEADTTSQDANDAAPEIIRKSELVFVNYREPESHLYDITFPRDGKVKWESAPYNADWAFNTMDISSDDYNIRADKFPETVSAGTYFVKLVSGAWYDQNYELDNAQLTYTYYPLCHVYYIDQEQVNELSSFYLQEQSENLSLPTGQLPDGALKGYRVDGWYEDRALTNPAAVDMSAGKDYYLYPRKTALDYTITYDLDGGQNAAANPASYTIEDGVVTLADPTREGYDFLGWYTDPPMQNKITAIDTTQCKDITLYAKWRIHNYQITYSDGFRHSNPSGYTITDEDITLSDPRRDGYTFTGWYLDEDHTRSIQTIDTSAAKDMTIYGAWEINTYTVSYELNGGTIAPGANIETYTVEEADFTLKNPVREHYDFGGWYTGRNFLNNITTIHRRDCRDLKLYAKWVEHPYHITYEDGYTHENPLHYTKSDRDITLQDASRPGYTFTGWYFDQEHTQRAEEIDTSRLVDVTLYGAWQINEYSVRYELNGGSISSDANITSYTVEDDTFILKSPKRDLYDFAGWYTDEELTQNIKEIDPSECRNLVLYARWEKHPFTITYYDGGTTFGNPIFYTFEDGTITLKDGQWKGYTFTGWYLDPEHTRKIEEIDASWCEDLKIYGAWTPNVYHVTYVLDDGKNAEENITEYKVTDSSFTLKAPTKYDCIFDGWYTTDTFRDGTKLTEIQTSTCQDITLYAKWVESNIIYSIQNDSCMCELGICYWTFHLPTNGKIFFSEHCQRFPEFLLDYTGEIHNAIFTYKDVTALNGYITAGKHTLCVIDGSWDGSVSYQFVPECNIYYIYQNSTEKLTSYYLTTFSNKLSLTKPTITGYRILSLYRDRDLTTPIKSVDTSVGKDWFLYPKVEPIVYSVSYDMDGGTNNEDNIQSYTIEDRDFTLKKPVKNGYTFDGWYTSPLFSWQNQITQIDTSTCENLTLYAKWSKNTYSVSYVDGYVHDNPSSFTVTDKDIVLESPEERAGYIFKGWYKDAAYSEKTDTIECSITGNITLYAKWEKIPDNTPEPTMTAPPSETISPTSSPAASAEPEESAPPTPSPTASAEPEESASPSPSPAASTEPEETALPTPLPDTGTEPEETASSSLSPNINNEPKTSMPLPDSIPEEPTEMVTRGSDFTAPNGYKYKFVAEDKVEYCGTSASFASVNVPDTIVVQGKRYPVVSIAAKAFANHRSLKSVTIGKNVTSIGKKAFYNCKKLKKITIRTGKLTKRNVGSKAFSGIHAKAVFKVPRNKRSQYKKIIWSRGGGKRVRIIGYVF